MSDYKQFAYRIGDEAAEIMRSYFTLGMQRDQKDDGSPVTEADLKINRLLINEVKKIFPTHGVLAEEESNSSPDQEYLWICDPIDGTIPFSHGVPISTFILALVQNGEPILGLIIDPFQKNYFYAEKGKGAFLNDTKISVSKNTNLKGAVVYSEHWRQAKFNTLPIIGELEQKDCHVPIMKSIAYGVALIAAGEADGVIFPAAHPWEMAACKIIIEEAGGKCTDFYGNEQRYDQDINGFVGSNGVIHEQLLTFTKQAKKSLE